MSSDAKTSGPGSAPTSTSAATKSVTPVTGKPDPRTDTKAKDYDRAVDPNVSDADLTVDEYLRRQGELAKLAIAASANGIKAAASGALTTGKSSAGGAAKGAADKFNPIHLVEKKPWIAVGVSAAVGFLGVMWWHPSRYGRVASRISKLEKKLKARDKEVVEVKAIPPKDPGKKTAAAGIGAVLLQQALSAAKPALMDRFGPLLAGLGRGGPDAEADAEAAPEADPVGASRGPADRFNPSL